MNFRAKTYRQFINEAYIDDSGELQDFEAPREDGHEYQIIDHAHRIQEYLEESGAEEVRLQVREGIIKFKFSYSGLDYHMELDLDLNLAVLSIGEIIIYEDSADSLFDLLASKGLEFLNY